ncbi:RNA recognition motif (RRM, RBD, or RNP domain) [Novymonas esmeraldas]|uniref:RNA recognition motif (RRM, RBD, or RNP domain) n=1 Tax=Novymonas esmeraldas TaxID=1808958 RepID=A0AAW0ETA8_9TRYP
MADWADTAQDEDQYQAAHGSDGGESEASQYEEPKPSWDTAKTETIVEVDAEGNRYEVVRKVRSYHVDRPITLADIRAKLGHFGKGRGDQSTLASVEPPLALEMGSVDQYERESRAEVKRMIHEASSIDVVVKDEHLRMVRDMEEKLKKDPKAARASGGTSTWGAVASKATDNREQLTTGIRIRNLSDDITQENLSRIFEGRGWITKNVRIPRGDNNQTRGFAFVIFEEAWMADAAIKEARFHFKNVVLDVSRAETRT